MAAVSEEAVNAEEKARRELKPRFDLEGATAVLRECFLHGDGHEEEEEGATFIEAELNSYDDQNFVVRRFGGGRCVLKIHNGVESRHRALIEAQSAMLAHLERGGVLAPREVAAPRWTTTTTTIGGEEDHHHCVRLLSWVNGDLLCDLELTTEVLRASGAFLGRVRRCLDGFDHAALHRDHAWDVRTTPWTLAAPAARLGDEGCDAGRCALVRRALEGYAISVEPLAPKLPFATLHGDYNDANVFVDRDDAFSTWAIVDIGDAIYSWRVGDVAVGLAYTLITLATKERKKTEEGGLTAKSAAFVIAGALAFVEGLAAEVALDGAEVAALPHLAACRLAMSFTFGWFSYRESLARNPDMAQTRRDYLLFHALPGADALKILFDALDQGHIQARLAAAFQHHHRGPQNPPS